MRYFILLIVCLLHACSLAPPFHPPTVPISAHYKETGKWLKATPGSANIARGTWWQLYQEPELNRLERQLCAHNQNLQAAIARYEQARAAAMAARSAYFPTSIAVGNASHQKLSNTVANPSSNRIYNDFLVGIDLSYELDVWGRVRNTVAAANQRAQASAADTASIQLSLQAELAIDYFSLRATDAAQAIYDKTELAYHKALDLTRERYRGGISSIADVAQAQTQYENAKTLSADNRLKRAQFEHAIAILIGQSPSCFSLPVIIKPPHLVVVAPNLPSTLLQRRPDIAAAELRVEAANAEIGVARAAYFPAINLAAGAGLESATLASLLKAPSFIWSAGPSSTLGALSSQRLPLINYTVFDGGKINALTKQAWAIYYENVALYRQAVLSAFQEVEDNLAALRQLDQENKTQYLAKNAAERALTQAHYQYRGGLTTYLDVVVIQNIALQNELSYVDVQVRRQIASVKLIKALGGGW